MNLNKTPDWMLGRARPAGLPEEVNADRPLTVQENTLVSMMMVDIPAKSLLAYMEDGQFPKPETLGQLFALDEWIAEQKALIPPVDPEADHARLFGN